MTRESRMLLIIGAMAVVAVVALGLMAKRYANIEPEMKSVHDVKPVAESFSSEQSPPPSWVDPIEGFIAVRSEIVNKLNEDPGMRRRMEQELSGNAREVPSRSHYSLIIGATMARNRGLSIAGIQEAEYHRVREAFVSWIRGEGDVDPELVEKFEANRERLEPLYLNDLEVLDQFIPPPSENQGSGAAGS